MVLPFGVAYLIEFAIYFGGEPEEQNLAEDSANWDGPVWENSGDGPDSRCQRDFLDSYGSCSATQGGPQGWNYLEGDYWKKLPGCYNYTTATPPSGGPFECGSDGYSMTINASTLFTFGKISPDIQSNFISGNTYTCDDDYFGNSRADYIFEFMMWEQTPTSNPLIFTWEQIDSVNLTGSSEFNSGGYNFEEGETCRATISLTHELGLSDLNSMEDLQNDYFEDIPNRTIYMRISIDNLETENGRAWDSTDYYSPFDGGYLDNSYMNVKSLSYEVDEIGLLVKWGIFLMGAGLWGIAIASTPYWNPLSEMVANK